MQLEWVENSGWPLKFQDLAPYYDRAAEFLGWTGDLCGDLNVGPGGVAGGLARRIGIDDVPAPSGAAGEIEAEWWRRASRSATRAVQTAANFPCGRRA
jgi:choline dehydrogenase-like flavoprotein